MRKRIELESKKKTFVWQRGGTKVERGERKRERESETWLLIDF